jgi:prepilin-type N-terminal cleavage/methylation domain-containing protein
MTRQRRAGSGFTLVEIALVIAIIGIAAAMAIPSLQTMTAHGRARDASATVADSLKLARAQAISSGSNVVVYFNTGLNGGSDICNNPLEDLNGDPVPILVLNDGPPGNPTANCCIDGGDTFEVSYPVQGVGWGTQLATVPAPNDPDAAANYTNGPTFTDPTGFNTEWVLFRPDGVPVGFADNGGPCAPGQIGSGGGALYLSNNERDKAVVLTPLGGVKVHTWERSTGVWTN